MPRKEEKGKLYFLNNSEIGQTSEATLQPDRYHAKSGGFGKETYSFSLKDKSFHLSV